MKTMFQRPMRFNPLSDKIFIWGMPGSGKSTFGRKLSSRLDSDFIDLDTAIEKEDSRTIPEIFRIEGEEYFRQLEKEVLQKIISNFSGVISTGGGTPCFFDNAARMMESGMTIFLDTDLEIILERVSGREGRPLLDQKVDKRKELELLWEKRRPFYTTAHLTIKKKPTDLLFQIDRFFAP